MGLTPTTDNKTGADCSGVSGESNRVLTLNNTGTTTTGGFLVYASGLALGLSTEYTVVHNSTGTQITFLNGMWDDMTIVVSYFQQPVSLGGLEIKRTDVQDIITDEGKEYVLIRPTDTTASMGDVTDIAEEEYNIFALIQDITRKDRNIHTMGLAVTGNSKAFFFHEYPDIITGNGTVSVEVGDIIEHSNGNKWRVEAILSQPTADNGDVFRTGIIKNIDLSE